MKIEQKRHPDSDADNKLLEANKWFLGIESESLSSEEMDAFADWVDADDANRENLELIGSVWSAMDTLKDDPLVIRPVEKSRAKEHIVNTDSWFSRLIPNLAGFRYYAAAVTLILILGGIWLARDNSSPSEIYTTAIGEQKTVYLSDGSTIYIDTNSAVSVRFTEECRYIELSKGKVYSSVAHDRTRPFVVLAGQIVARALGTEFEVYKMREEKVAITVSNGHVQVNSVSEKYLKNVQKGLPIPAVQSANEQKLSASRSDTSILSGQVLEPGQGILVDENKEEYVLTSSDRYNVGVWRKGRLNFQSKALSEIIEELNRYLTDKIIIGDDTLKNLKVSVYFKINDHKYFVATLENTLPITSQTLTNGQVVLFRRE